MFPIRQRKTALAAALFLSGLSSVAYLMWAADEPAPVPPVLPTVVVGPRVALSHPDRHLAVDVREFDDELAACAYASTLRFASLNGAVPLVAVDASRNNVVVRLELPNDLTVAIPLAARLRQQGITASDWYLAESSEVTAWKETSALCERLYAHISPGAIARSRGQSRPVSDIVTIAAAFRVPLRLFDPALVPNHPAGMITVWKRLPQPDDVVLLRVPGRALTANRNMVGWQEIQRAIVHARSLLESDRRDLEHLPVRLRPPPDAKGELQPTTLFTYAAVLLKDLVKKAGGDRPELLAAYTGRPDDENVRHDIGVRRVAFYARRVLTHAYFVTRQQFTDDLQD